MNACSGSDATFVFRHFVSTISLPLKPGPSWPHARPFYVNVDTVFLRPDENVEHCTEYLAIERETES